MAYYIDTNSFETATGLWTDTELSIIAPDGFYGDNGVYRQMQAGVLLPSTICPDCITTTTTTTTTTSDCGCNKYTIFVSQSDIDDATGNTDTSLNLELIVTYNDCSGNQVQIKLGEAGFWTNIICVDQLEIIYLTYWKNDVENQALTSYSVDTGIKCCVDATTTTTTTSTTSTTTTEAPYSQFILYLDTATGTGFENPFATCYAGSPFILYGQPGYTSLNVYYADGGALYSNMALTNRYNGQNRWFRAENGDAIQIGIDGFIIVIASFASIGCPTTTTTTSTTTTSTTTTAGPTTTTTTTTTTTAEPTTTTSTTTTTTTLPPGTCGVPVNYSGGPGWPTSKSIFVGSATGTIALSADADSLPDRFIVKIASTVVIDTGFQGNVGYDFGGPLRNNFKSWITGRVDPITSIAYPDLANFPDDGYPRVCCGSAPVITYGSKPMSDDTAIVEVYGSSPSTGWRYTLYCVNDVPTTTTSTTTTTTLSPEMFRYGILTVTGGIAPIPGAGDITILSGTLGGDPDGSINIPFNSGVNDFLWFAIPSSKPVKTAWFVSVLNQGSIGGAVSQYGNLFPDPVLKTESGTEFNLYISNYRTQVVNMTISE